MHNVNVFNDFQGSEGLFPASPGYFDGELSFEQKRFSALLGGGNAAGTDNLFDSQVSKSLFTHLALNVPQFSSADAITFMVFFPDGAQANVVAVNREHKLEISIKTNSERLKRTLRNRKKQTEGAIAANYDKPVSLVIF